MANDDAQLQAQLAEMLHALYQGTDAAARRRADRWLQQVQRAPEGWALSDSILGGRSPLCPRPPDLTAHPLSTQAVQFAALTLHAKVSGDLHELAVDQAAALRAAALAHLDRWSGPGVPSVVPKKLCLAVAALAVSTSWDGALAHVQESLQRNADDVAAACRSRAVAVELLAALPEQCFSKQFNVPLSRREHFNKYLRDAAGGVLGVLTQLVGWASSDARAADAAGATKLTTAAFECLRAWISFCGVPPDQLAASPLFTGAFNALQASELFDVATDVVVEALRRFDCRDPAAQPLVAAVAPRVMALAPRFDAARAAEDDDEALGLCRVFCEMGEAYMPMIASSADCNQGAIVDVMLRCTEYPARKVAQIPLRFWYHLARALSRMDAQDPARAKVAQVVQEPYRRLARLCVRLAVRHPDNDIDQNDPEGEGDEYARHRSDLFDAWGDCSVVCGPEAVLAAVAEELQLATRPATATCDGVEACLFALRALADFVPTTESSVLPAAMAMIAGLPADWRRARTQACQLVGAYASWLRAHAAQSLQACVQFLLAELAAAPPRAAAAGKREHSSHAARAFKKLCDKCAAELAAAGALGLADQVTGDKLPLKDELELLEGLGAVVGASGTYDAVLAGCQALAGPPAQALARLAADPAADPRAVARELDRVTAVVRCASPPPQSLADGRPHPVLVVVEGLWPTFEAVAARMRSSHLVVEKLCRCYKHAMRSCRKHFEPLLQRMTAHLVRALEEGVVAAQQAAQAAAAAGQNAATSAPLSSFVYCASICITEFGDEPAKAPGLFEMLTKLSAATFALLATPADFGHHPDVVEEFFYLAARFLDYCPAPLLAAPLLGHMLRSAAMGLGVEHREALRGVLHFCGEAAAAAVLALKRAGGPLPPAVAATEPTLAPNEAPRDEGEVNAARDAAQKLRRLLVEEDCGARLVDGLLRALAGDLPASFLEEGRGSLLGCLWKLRLFCPPQAFAGWCQSSLAVVTAKFQSQEITADLLRAVAVDPPRHDAFAEAFVVFARCFQSSKRSSRRR